ncbi:MAG: NAD-dependent epimerase/dehydratase family protein [bacterium]
MSFNDLKTVIIGGGGFIGRRVTKLLTTQRSQIIVLGRAAVPICELPPESIYLSGDYGDRKTLQSVLEPGCEVIDLAYSTVPKTSFENPVFDLVSNLPCSVGLLEECLRVGVGRLVLVSSGGTVYGSVDSLPITEDHPTRPISPYGITKLAIDRYAMMFHRNNSLPVTVVRPGNAYGEDQRSGTGQGFIAAAIDAILSRNEIEIFGVHGTIRDYIHVNDVASGIVAALEKGEDGAIYNIGTGIGSSNADVIKMLEVLAVDEGIDVKQITRPARRFDVEANILDSTRLWQRSGWKAKVDIEQGIKKMWQSRLSSRGH